MKHFLSEQLHKLRAVLSDAAGRIPIRTPRFITRITSSEKYQKITAFCNRHSLLFHIPLSMGFCFIMEWMSRHSFTAAVSFVTDHTLPFLYNSYVIFIVFTLVYLTKRQTFLRMCISAFFVMLGITNGIILLNRVTPFGFTDLYMIADLLTMQNTKYFTRGQAAVSLLAILIYIGLMAILFVKGKKQETRSPFWVRLLLVIAAFVSFPFVTNGLQSTNVLASYFGNLAQGYADYGYIYGFTTSIFNRGMEKPFGYSASTVDRILEQTDMGDSTIDVSDGPNVIVVLLESFYDVSEADFIKTQADVTPYFHYLEENYSTGHLTVPVVGAGTCNTEFEVLTGMSCQFFGPGEYPQKTILKETDCESFADITKELGYGTHVVHNNGGNFYSRKNAFSMMGFDTFTSKEMLDITEYTPLGTWARDDILVEATRNALDATPQKDFVYTITVEPHGDYPKQDVLGSDAIDVTCVGKDAEQTNQWKYYINMLHREDTFIRSFISMLAQRDEDTLVIMFGDHLPTMGLNSSEVATGDLFQTKYITWNNFSMEKQDMDLTSYQLVPEYFDRLGIHGGTILNYNQAKTQAGIRAGSYAYMNDLETLQYDLLYGKRYAYDGEDRYPASDIVMGVSDIVIDRMYAYAGKLHIYGENFTPWSAVYTGDERIPTTYVSGQCLTINLSEIENGDPIIIRQMGSSNTIFRSSNIYYYYDRSDTAAVP